MTTAERIASALELMALQCVDPDERMVVRVAELEDLLQQVVSLVNNPRSTDDEWVELMVVIANTLPTVQ